MFRIKYSREIILKILYQLDILKCDAAQSGPLIEEYFKSFQAASIPTRKNSSAAWCRSFMDDKERDRRLDHRPT